MVDAAATDDINTIVKTVNSPFVVAPDTELEQQYDTAAYTSRLDKLMTQVKLEIEVFKNMKIATNNSAWEDKLSRITIKMKMLSAEFVNVLNIQEAYLTIKQMQMYNLWIQMIQNMGIYALFGSESKQFRVLAARLNELLFLQKDPENLQEILDKTLDTTSDVDINSWLYESNVTFQSFTGRKEIIKELQAQVNFMPLQSSYALLCFTGPPGTGKSEFAKAIMNEFHATSYMLNIPELSSKWVGVTENAIKRLFQTISDPANRHKNYVLFFDEADNLFSNKIPALQSLAIAIQTALAGTYTLGNNIIIIFATNYRKSIPPPILDRIKKIMFIDVPSREELEQFLDKYYQIASAEGTTEYVINTTYKHSTLDAVYNMLIKKATCTYRNLYNLCEIAKNKCIMSVQASVSQEIHFFVVATGEFHYNFIMVGGDIIDTVGGVARHRFTEDLLQTLDQSLPRLKNTVLILTTWALIELAKHESVNILMRPTFESFKLAAEEVNFMTERDYKTFVDENKNISFLG